MKKRRIGHVGGAEKGNGYNLVSCRLHNKVILHGEKRHHEAAGKTEKVGSYPEDTFL